MLPHPKLSLAGHLVAGSLSFGMLHIHDLETLDRSCTEFD